MSCHNQMLSANPIVQGVLQDVGHCLYDVVHAVLHTMFTFTLLFLAARAKQEASLGVSWPGGKQNHVVWSCGCLADTTPGSVTFFVADRICREFFSLQSAFIISDIRNILGSLQKTGVFKPLTVWFIKAAARQLSKCHRGGSSSLLMLSWRGAVMTGLKVFRQPRQCSTAALMPSLVSFEYRLWGCEQESFLRPRPTCTFLFRDPHMMQILVFQSNCSCRSLPLDFWAYFKDYCISVHRYPCKVWGFQPSLRGTCSSFNKH